MESQPKNPEFRNNPYFVCAHSEGPANTGWIDDSRSVRDFVIPLGMGVWEQQSGRPACPFTQSDQRLCYSLI